MENGRELKKNVDVFNQNVRANEGYKYTTNAPFSSIVANRRLTEETLAAIPVSSRSVLDIGCGDGSYTAEIKKARPELRIGGFDPASEAIRLAAAKYPDISFYFGNILNEKDLPPEKYDIGILRGVLHHLTDPELAIKNSFLASDNLIIIEPNGNNPILKIIEKVSKYHIEHEERSFSVSRLSRFVRSAGGAVVKIKHVGFVPFFCPAPFAKIIYFFQPFLEKIPLLRHFFAAQIVLTAKKAGAENKL
jgi:SAM-dependent methyltransferase